MTVTARDSWTETNLQAIREQLGRILNSAPFAQSRRRKRFLEYIVSETLAGRGDRLKGYTIAVEAFDRPATFDANLDPFVRIEAARLRDRLREYYALEGQNDSIRIDLPKGTYVPMIEFRATPQPDLGIATVSNSEVNDFPTCTLNTRPSIAVLPFVNMSARRADDYLSDAITENIITALSRFREFAVVASYSVFSYKGKGIRIPEIARDLGVKFVLEGSVQKSKERVRVTAQLIDGSTGAHLWAERFDRPYGNLLAVLDEVTEQIVGRLGSPYTGRLGRAWRDQADSGTPRRLEAYDHLLAGLDLFDDYLPGCMAKARECFFKAIDLDPGFGKAYAKIAFSHIFDVWYGWTANSTESLADAQKFLRLATTRDDDESWGYWASGAYNILIGQHDRAIASYRRAMQLNPNDPDLMADFGACLSWAGRSSEAVEMIRNAIQLNPLYPEWWLLMVGQIYFDARLYQEAVAALEGAQSLNVPANCLMLAASHAALGNAERARAAIAKARESDAGISLSSIKRGFFDPYKETTDREHLRLNLVKAGLPP